MLVVWRDPPASGPVNMAADELLASRGETGGIAIRLYRWEAPTFSLGGFQRADSAAWLADHGIPLVRRPSGGGGILHGGDLTYAAAVSREHPLGRSPQRFYDVLHAAMVKVLSPLGLAAGLHGGPAEGERPEGPLFCFDRRSVGDVVAGRHKLLGSAQRRLAAAVLQHGSLLLRRLDVPAEVARHPGLEELLGRGIHADTLGLQWVRQVADDLGLPLEVRGELLDRQAREAIVGRIAHFASDRWLRRR